MATDFTPEVSRALARLFSAIDAVPEVRNDILKRVPDDAKTVHDLPEDLLWLYQHTVGEETTAPEDARPTVSATIITAPPTTRTLTLNGKPITFSVATAAPAEVEVEACDSPQLPAAEQQRALHPDDLGNGDLTPPRFWRGQLVPYNEQAPDGRVIAAPRGEPKSRTMPLPLTAQIATADGHDNSVTIGRVNRIWNQGGALWGEGEFDLGTAEGRDWAGRVGRGMAGWGSVDLDSGIAPRIESQGQDRVPRKTYPDWTFAGFTLVSRPAFDSARIGAFYPGMDDDTEDDADEEACLVFDPDTGECLDEQLDEDDIRRRSNRRMPPEVRRVLADVNMAAADAEPDPADCGCPDEAQAQLAAGGSTTLPLGDRGTAWDKNAADARVRAWAGVDADEPSPAAWTKYGQAHFWHAPDADTFGAFKLPFADVVDGKLVAVPRGVFAAAAAMQGSRSGVDVPEADRDGIRSKISAYYRKMKMRAPWDTKTASADLMNEHVMVAGGEYKGTVVGFDAAGGWLRIATGNGCELICSADEVESSDSLTAAGIIAPVAPDDAWFDNPQLSDATPITIGDDGRVFGHLALWGSCHIGYADTCVTAPRSSTGYAAFHVGEVVTASGKRLPVGKVTLGGGHAAAGAGWRAAAAHYDNAGAAVAVVRAGEDQHGIWIAGALVPDVTATQLAALRRSPLSGDWRRIGGSMELVAALAVNTPGFPVPRPRAALVASRQASLVAAGVLDPGEYAMASRIEQVVTSALENVLEAYAARRERAAAASARIAELTMAAEGGCECGECGCDAADDEDEDDEDGGE